MPFKKVLAKVFLFAILQAGALAGVPMSPEQIEKVMNAMHRTNIVQMVKKDEPLD